PIRTPEIIAWVAMGFAVDDGFARKIRDLYGVEVTLAVSGPAGITHVASSLPSLEHGGPPGDAEAGNMSVGAASTREPDAGESSAAGARVMRLGDTSYLTVVQRLDSRGEPVEAI